MRPEGLKGFYFQLSASVAAGGYSTVTVSGGDLSRPDFKGARAFLAASGTADTNYQTSADLFLPKYTEVSGTDIKFVALGAVASANIPVSGTSNVVLYNQQPTDDNRGDFEDATSAGRPNANSTNRTNRSTAN